MNLLGEARTILGSAGYATMSGQADDIFSFEDSTLLGFVWVAPSVQALLEGWQKKQDDFLSARDRELRRAKEKSWNVYSVLLTEDEANEGQDADLMRVEEDFRGTRKIARSGLRATYQVNRAILPLLPIQNRLSLGDVDVLSRLRDRLTSINGRMAEILLQETSTESTVDLLLDADENS
jgi:hypothetical protein